MCAVQAPTFGLLLKRHRRAAGMTQEELAERSGMSGRAIGDLERGVRLPRRDTLRLLLEALELAPGEEARLEAAARVRSQVAPHAGPLLQIGSYLGARPPGRLVGSQRALHRALAALDAVVGGDGRLVLLTGEPGIGKTRLAQELALEAGRHGFLVATGRCYEPEQDIPYYPFLEVQAGVYAAVPRTIRDEIPRRWPGLGGLLPEDADPTPRPWTGGLEGQQRLFRALSGFLGAVAEETPVAVLLDDLHWADDASLKLLFYLARHTRSTRVLLVGTYRDVEVHAGHPLERALVDLNRERLVERVVVHRLDLKGTTELIGEALGGDVAVWPELAAMVHDATTGSPFFSQEIVRMLVERGDLYQYEGRWQRRDIQEIRPPETVRAAIRERLTHLRPATVTMLHEASVLGQTFDFDDLRALGSRDEEELDEALKAAVGAGLVRETAPGHYAFNHALTQQALYADLSTWQRRRLHLMAGDTIEQLPQHVRERRAAELAWHFRTGGNVEGAVLYAVLAGDRAEAVFAYDDALRHFRAAVELASASGWEASDPALHPRALSRLGRVLNITEQYDEALGILEQAADLYRAQGDQQNAIALDGEIGWIHYSRGTGEQGIARIQPLIAAFDREPPSELRDRALARCHIALARLFFGLGRYGDELAAAQCAVVAARKGSDALIDAWILEASHARRGAALMTLGRRDEARAALNETIVLAEANGNLGPMGAALGHLSEISCDAGDYRRGREEIERALQAAEQTGLPGRIGWALIKLGRVLRLMGEWHEARAAFERSAQQLGDDARSAIYPRVHLMHLDLLEGNAERAIAAIEASMDTTGPGRDRWLLRYAQRILAENELLDGRPAAALPRLETLLAGQGPDQPHAILLYSLLACAYVELGREDGAERTLSVGLERAQRQGYRVAESDLLRVRGMLRSRQGRWSEARSSLDEAIRTVQRMPDPYREALARAEMGALASRMGDLAAAVDRREEAFAIARGIGAVPCARYIERLMSRAPASIPMPSRD